MSGSNTLFVLPIYAMATIALLLPTPGGGAAMHDGLIHVGLFGGLAIATVVLTKLPIHLAALVAAGFGAFTELAQAMLPWRTGSLSDLGADIVGVAAGIAIVLAARRLRMVESHRAHLLLVLLAMPGLVGCTASLKPANVTKVETGQGYQAQYRNRPVEGAAVTAALNAQQCRPDPKLARFHLSNVDQLADNPGLSPGDLVEIRVAEDEELSGQVVVAQDGQLQLPYLRPIATVDQSAPQLEQAVARRLIEQGFYVGAAPPVSVRVLEYAPIRIAVSGALFEPGTVTINTASVEQRDLARQAAVGDAGRGRSLSAAVRAAAGVRPDADLENVVIVRSGKAVRVDMSDALQGLPFHDPVLRDGDTVYLPQRNCFQAALMRPSVITPPGIKVFMSNLTTPASSNAQSAIGINARELKYGTRLLKALVGMNCVGGTHLTNANRFAVLISQDPVTRRTSVVEREIEGLVRHADRDEYDPFLLPGDAIACYDSTFTNLRDVVRAFGEVLGPASLARLL